MELAGSRFAAHPPIEPFKVFVTRPDHALTTGLRDFRIEDELYLTRPTAEIDVLLHTSFTGSCPEFRDAEWDEPQVPVLYLRKLGKGAVLYLTLGHCRGHYDMLPARSEEHTSELQSLMRISYAVFCLKKNKITISTANINTSVSYYTTLNN